MTDSKTAPKTAPKKADTPAATVAQAQPKPAAVDDPYAGFTPSQLKTASARLKKAGDEDGSKRLTARAKLAEQQAEQRKQEAKQKTADRDAVIAFLNKTLADAYGSGKLSPPEAPFKVRIGNEPPDFCKLASGSKKEGAGDDRPSISGSTLKGAGVSAFLLPDGSEVAPATVNGKPQAAHPVAYLNAFAPDSVCYYDRACRSGHEKSGANELKKFTEAQQQDMNDGRGLRHGDAASRAFASLAVSDDTHNVKMNDGSVITVQELTSRILAAPAA